MNHYQFATLVAQMRDAQKQYFADRTRTSLREAKALEQKVDTYLLTYMNEYEGEQLTLLGEPEPAT